MALAFGVSKVRLTWRVEFSGLNHLKTKKEHFKDLLHHLYGGKPDINALIDTISAGAEHTVLSIPKKNQLHRGSVNILYNKIIIASENIRKTGNHAKEQLDGYLLNLFTEKTITRLIEHKNQGATLKA